MQVEVTQTMVLDNSSKNRAIQPRSEREHENSSRAECIQATHPDQLSQSDTWSSSATSSQKAVKYASESASQPKCMHEEFGMGEMTNPARHGMCYFLTINALHRILKLLVVRTL